MRRQQRGFTLIEMLIVLVILGLLATMIAGRGPMRSGRLDFDGTVREIAGSLRLARSRAIAQNRGIRWMLTASGYGAEGEAPHRLPSDIAASATGPIGFSPEGGSNGGRVLVRGGERRITIDVDWLTGRVHVQGS